MSNRQESTSSHSAGWADLDEITKPPYHADALATRWHSASIDPAQDGDGFDQTLALVGQPVRNGNPPGNPFIAMAPVFHW